MIRGSQSLIVMFKCYICESISGIWNRASWTRSAVAAVMAECHGEMNYLLVYSTVVSVQESYIGETSPGFISDYVENGVKPHDESKIKLVVNALRLFFADYRSI